MAAKRPRALVVVLLCAGLISACSQGVDGNRAQGAGQTSPGASAQPAAPEWLTVITEGVAGDYGDESPDSRALAKTTYGRAAPLVGLAPNSLANPEHPVYLVVAQGTFGRGPAVSDVADAKASWLLIVVDAERGRVTDVGIFPTSPDLSDVGELTSF